MSPYKNIEDDRRHAVYYSKKYKKRIEKYIGMVICPKCLCVGGLTEQSNYNIRTGIESNAGWRVKHIGSRRCYVSGKYKFKLSEICPPRRLMH